MKDKVLTTIDEHYVPLSSISAISGFYYHDLGSKWYYIYLKSGDKLKIQPTSSNRYKIDKDRDSIVKEFTEYINLQSKQQ